MITPVGQRWRDRRARYRLAGMRGETFQPRLYEVAEIPDDTTAKRYVINSHYSGTYPSAIERFGLYRRAELVGCFIGSIGMPQTLPSVFPDSAGTAIECGRFILSPEVPLNGESWFQARCHELLQNKGYTGLLAFSDDIPRTDAGERLIFQGHLGICYKSTNALFLGRATPRSLRLLPDGRVFSERALSKIRQGESGWRAACQTLQDFGAPRAPEETTERSHWLNFWLPLLTRPLKHPGNLKYVWRLHPLIKINGIPQKYPIIKYQDLQPTLF